MGIVHRYFTFKQRINEIQIQAPIPFKPTQRNPPPTHPRKNQLLSDVRLVGVFVGVGDFVGVGILRNGRLSSRYTVYINVQGCSSPVFPQLHAAVIIPASAFFVGVGVFVGVGIIRNGNLSSRYMVYMNVQGCSSPVFPQLQGLSQNARRWPILSPLFRVVSLVSFVCLAL